jgi:outer membrane immunogenic protein
MVAAALILAATGAQANGWDKPYVHDRGSWTGLYMGGQAGYAFGSNADYDYLIAGNFEPVGRIRPTSPNGFAGGGHVGVQHQTGMFVVGVEGSVLAGSLKDTLSENPPPLGNDYNTNTDVRWLTTGVVRAGVLFDRTLFYLRGGIAYGKVDFDASFFNKDGPGGTNGSLVKIQNDFGMSGYVVGGGIEFKLGHHWILGVEYNHIDLGSATAILPTTNSGITTESIRINYDLDLVTARLSYQF